MPPLHPLPAHDEEPSQRAHPRADHALIDSIQRRLDGLHLLLGSGPEPRLIQTL